MADITVKILENIRQDIAALDTKLTGRIDALDRRLTGRFDLTNEALTGVIAVMGVLARNDEDIKSRLRALETRVFGAPAP